MYIGVFDSGVGGLTTLAALHRALPRENFLYYGDTLHTPYGGRPPAQVLQLTQAATGQMLPWGLKALVLACNAATSAAAAQLRQELALPVLGLEPAVKPALAASRGLVVALGTELTVGGEKFHQLLATLPQSERVIPLACPGLVELIEKDPAQAAIEDYLQAKLAPYQGQIQALVLGCTHYVFLRPLLGRLWPGLPLFDGNAGLSRHLAGILAASDEHKQQGQQKPLGQVLFLGSSQQQACFRRFYDFCLQEGI